MSKESTLTNEELARKIFISHRHADKPIADALRKQLLSWGIPKEYIFQSSNYKHSGKIGRPIKAEIKKFLVKATLVILIYTSRDVNWEYHMWECGLATDPKTVKTNVLVLQCTEDAPRVFRDELLVHVDIDGIRRFTRQFHNDDGFFPGLGPFMPDLGEEGIDIRCAGLMEALSQYCLNRNEEMLCVGVTLPSLYPPRSCAASMRRRA